MIFRQLINKLIMVLTEFCFQTSLYELQSIRIFRLCWTVHVCVVLYSSMWCTELLLPAPESHNVNVQWVERGGAIMRFVAQTLCPKMKWLDLLSPHNAI
jgi:hypothetical protein